MGSVVDCRATAIHSNGIVMQWFDLLHSPGERVEEFH